MTKRDITAILAALAMLKTPALVRSARRMALPPGMTFLLEVAANDAAAIDTSTAMSGHCADAVRSACGFFIEQILLTNINDSYRILASDPDTPANELRRNMALLMRWLHPDVAANTEIDRSVFANRVTQAWEDLKTEERRAAYALKHKNKYTPLRKKQRHSSRGVSPIHPARNASDKRPGNSHGDVSAPAHKQARSQSKKHRHKRLVIRPLGNDGLLSRLVLLLKGQR